MQHRQVRVQCEVYGILWTPIFVRRHVNDRAKDKSAFRRGTSRDELRSYLGLATYYGRFIKNLAGNSDKLWHLCKKGVNFDQKEFDAIKENVISKALGHYNHQWTTVLEVDASPIWGGSATPPIQPKGQRG